MKSLKRLNNLTCRFRKCSNSIFLIFFACILVSSVPTWFKSMSIEKGSPKDIRISATKALIDKLLLEKLPLAGIARVVDVSDQQSYWAIQLYLETTSVPTR